MYNSDFALELRRQIAVNDRYICYALRQGQLRVLHRQSAERALLKSKGAAVTDVQCAPAPCCCGVVLHTPLCMLAGASPRSGNMPADCMPWCMLPAPWQISLITYL